VGQFQTGATTGQGPTPGPAVRFVDRSSSRVSMRSRARRRSGSRSARRDRRAPARCPASRRTSSRPGRDGAGSGVARDCGAPIDTASGATCAGSGCCRCRPPVPEPPPDQFVQVAWSAEPLLRGAGHRLEDRRVHDVRSDGSLVEKRDGPEIHVAGVGGGEEREQPRGSCAIRSNSCRPVRRPRPRRRPALGPGGLGGARAPAPGSTSAATVSVAVTAAAAGSFASRTPAVVGPEDVPSSRTRALGPVDRAARRVRAPGRGGRCPAGARPRRRGR